MNAQLIIATALQLGLVVTCVCMGVAALMHGIREGRAHKARLARQSARMASPEYVAARDAAAAAWTSHLAGQNGAFSAWKAASREMYRLSAY